MTKDEKRMIAEKAADFIEREGTKAREAAATLNAEAASRHVSNGTSLLLFLREIGLISEEQRYQTTYEFIQEAYGND